MLTTDLTKLTVLHPVRTDFKLDKFIGKTDNSKSVRLEMEFALYMPEESHREFYWDGVPFHAKRIFDNPIKRKLGEAYIRFRMLFVKDGVDPTEAFLNIKQSFDTLEKPVIDIDQARELINKLESSHQEWAFNNAKTLLTLSEYESILIQDGQFVRYQSEENIVRFIKQCKEGLCLSEIKHFTKVIPDDVLLKLNQAEKLKVFDNYYILYYDPLKIKNQYYTEMKKDPIIFGVIANSTKLYFIADWIDDYCGLTYSEILKSNPNTQLG